MSMKEFSIEEKAKRYDEAIEIAKEINNEHRAQPFNVLTRVFPELKESEDERIMRKLLAFIEWAKSYAASGISYDEAKEMTTWVEKQGKNGTNGNERKIPNPAWSEEDEEELENIIDFLNNPSTAELCPTLRSSAIDWLKSLKDRVQPQPQKEWSEEDERMRNASIRACQYMVEHFENSTWDYEDAIDWLNSLKNCVQPQWKPSEEQMAHLVAAIEESDGNCILQSLYNDLKKL